MSFSTDSAIPNAARIQIGRRIIKNSLSHYIAAGFDGLTNLVSIGLLSRHLGVNDFGKYAFVVAFAAIFKVMSGMGVPVIVVREIARDKDRSQQIYASAFLLHVFFSLITLTVMIVSINLISSSGVIKTATALCAIAVVLELFSRLFSAVFQAYEKMEYDAYQTIFAQSIYMISIMCVVKFGYGFTEVFIALIFTFASECMFGFCMVNGKFVRLRLKGNCNLWKYLLKEAYPIGVKRILRQLNLRIDTLVLAAMKSSVEVGLFHGVYKIVQSLMFLAEGATKAIFPAFSRYSTTSKTSLQQGYEKSFKFLILIGLPFGIFFSYFSKPVITLILGKAFVEATPVLQIFGWVLALMFLSNLMEQMLIVGGNQFYTLLATIVSLCINLALDILLIPKMNYIGASLATLASEIVMFGVTFYFVSRYVSYLPVSKVVLKPILASITTCIILFYIYQINIYMAVSCGILVYVVTLFLIKTFTQDEISIFRQLMTRRKPVLD